MKNAGEIRWIQLSDLHIFNSTEVDRQRKALYKKFAGKIDFFVITGDLHQYKTNYDLSKKFLDELITKMQIETKDIIIIPGNHDVVETQSRKRIVENIDNNIESNPDAYLKDLDKLLKDFKNFKDFLIEFYGEYINQFNILNNDIYIWDNRIAILCLNTAIISDKNHYKPQIIDINGLEKVKNNIFPCIAIMHHDYYSIADIHKPFIRTRFKELGVSATLSGHKHKFSSNIIDLGNGETIPNYCCAKSVSKPGDMWSDVGLIEYRWKIDEQKVKVIPYEWNSETLNFIPSTRLENQEDVKVDDDGSILLKKNFKIRKIEDSIVNKLIDEKKIINEQMEKEFEEFYTTVQIQYLDGILEYIGYDDQKFKYAKDMMETIIWYDDKKIEFDKMFDLVIKCKEKMVLSINGLQGTGKSTFMSLLYYKMMKNVKETHLFPVLIDLHYLEQYSKVKAKSILREHLVIVDRLIKGCPQMKFLLMFDGADEYFRKTSGLEDILFNYVDSHSIGNFAFCIGSAEKLPYEMIQDGKLQSISRKAIYKVQAHRIDKENEEDISFIIKNLRKIYGFKVEEKNIQVIKRAINVYAINKIDYRTLLIVLRIFDNISINDRELQLGSYFYEYYKMEMKGDEKELIKHSKAAYEYTVLKKKNALGNLKYAKIIYNNVITRDFLIAYYFVHLIRENDPEIDNVLTSNFVFTASVNKFIKDLILNKYKKEQNTMVYKLIEAYEKSDIPMKSQICYILGRIEENNAKSVARSFLTRKWDSLYEALFDNNILVSQDLDIKNKLVLFRTVSVSLIWLDYYKNQENFLKCIILNEKLNQINRGFHLEYYEDKSYINGESPTYIDDDSISVENTMKYLSNNINKGFSSTREFNKSIYLDIITLFSIYQYRMENKAIKEKYEEKLIEIADKILKSPKIQSKTIINYVTTIRELLPLNPYKILVNEIYQVKIEKRAGWVRRNVNLPESIADHMYGCYMLGLFFLPNRVKHCIDYEIPDIDSYELYSKDRILQMLLLHDLAEAKIGDIVTQEKGGKDYEKECKRFDYYEYLCSFPKIYGLGNQKAIWDEFAEKSTINAKVANDIDKIELVIQANIYKRQGNVIDMDEWIDYARQNVQTTLGKQFLDFMLDAIIS